jgi:nucleoside-diphosphate-sugar epimerase
MPVETYAVNVMGTVHLLETVRHCSSVRAVVNVTQTHRIYLDTFIDQIDKWGNLPNMAYSPEVRLEMYRATQTGLTQLERNPEKQRKYADFINFYADLNKEAIKVSREVQDVENVIWH